MFLKRSDNYFIHDTQNYQNINNGNNFIKSLEYFKDIIKTLEFIHLNNFSFQGKIQINNMFFISNVINFFVPVFFSF